MSTPRPEPRIEPSIESMRPEDWPAVGAIYAEGIATGVATFETDVPGWDAWDESHVRTPRLVARSEGDAGRILGWAALAPVSRRAVYRGVGDVSIYIAGSARGRGVGRALLQALVRESHEAGFWTLQSSIFAANAPSLALHRACGFREVGRRERIARRDGVWHDTILMELREIP